MGGYLRYVVSVRKHSFRDGNCFKSTILLCCTVLLCLYSPPVHGAEILPAKPDKLIIRTWPGPWELALHRGVSEPFSRRHGISIEYDTRDDKELLELTRKALDNGERPPTDLNWDTTITAMKAAKSGYVQPLSKAQIPHLNDLHPSAEPEAEGEWPFVNLYTYTVVLAYRTDIITSPPTSWKILLDDRWRKSVGMYRNGYGFHPIAAILSGGTIPEDMEPAWKLYRKLKPNIGLLGWDDELTRALINGTTPLQTSIISNVIQAKREGAPVAWAVPEEGVLLERDAMWIPANLPVETSYWAMKYIDFALSVEAQDEWCELLGTLPMNKYSRVPDYMRHDPAFFTSGEKFKRMIVIPTEIMVKHRHQWFEKFKEIMQ